MVHCHVPLKGPEFNRKKTMLKKIEESKGDWAFCLEALCRIGTSLKTSFFARGFLQIFQRATNAAYPTTKRYCVYRKMATRIDRQMRIQQIGNRSSCATVLSCTEFVFEQVRVGTQPILMCNTVPTSLIFRLQKMFFAAELLDTTN